ncbi:response regulator transcription factor [Xanthocytophaga flava]|uniref:response regulator transcription factor n=1 Tax=Xanthocytophaga flava TaxID=3048013 RepID=UPI0028D4D048|nr:response regulator transcription factor [Xanthocytophaga flavus]MDJ1467841.1 response regulator transcription factor [Xanthocytophaga flavus]
MKKTILVVDDEPSIRLILEHYLGLNFQVFAKNNGSEALDWLQAGNKTDAIIADYSMPLMDGLEFVGKIRSLNEYKNIPLIMLSGKDETKEKIKCLKAGADDYMIKPFNPEELEVRIANILRRVG